MKKSVEEIKQAIVNQDVIQLKPYCTENGWEAIKYNFGDITKETNQKEAKRVMLNVLNSHRRSCEGDTCWIISSKPTGIKSASTIEVVKISNNWYLNDFRMGK